MASYTVVKNTSIEGSLETDFQDQGWVVSNGIATHGGCNAGFIDFKMDLSAAINWIFQYRIIDMTSGAITLYVDGVAQPSENTVGLKTAQIVSSNSLAEIKFYSTGINSLSVLMTYPQTDEDNGRTLVFNENENQWNGDHGYKPEVMVKFKGNLIVFKDGAMWRQNTNPIANNFMGVQQTSKIKVVANENAAGQKRYIMMKVDANSRWGAREISILPNETYPLGMTSLLHEDNFSLDKGEYWASFLRDMNDPQFTSQAQAIFEGRELEGKLLVLSMESVSTKQIELKALYIYSTDKFRNFLSPSPWCYKRYVHLE